MNKPKDSDNRLLESAEQIINGMRSLFDIVLTKERLTAVGPEELKEIAGLLRGISEPPSNDSTQQLEETRSSFEELGLPDASHKDVVKQWRRLRKAVKCIPDVDMDFHIDGDRKPKEILRESLGEELATESKFADGLAAWYLPKIAPLVDLVQSVVAACNDCEASLNDLNKESDRIKDTNKSLSEENASLRKEKDSLNEELGRARKQLQENLGCLSENKTLKQGSQALRDELKKAREEHEAEMDEAASLMERAKAEINRLKTALAVK